MIEGATVVHGRTNARVNSRVRRLECFAKKRAAIHLARMKPSYRSVPRATKYGIVEQSNIQIFIEAIS